MTQTRIVALGGPHIGPRVRSCMGDSRGGKEGALLIGAFHSSHCRSVIWTGLLTAGPSRDGRSERGVPLGTVQSRGELAAARRWRTLVSSFRSDSDNCLT